MLWGWVAWPLIGLGVLFFLGTRKGDARTGGFFLAAVLIAFGLFGLHHARRWPFATTETAAKGTSVSHAVPLGQYGVAGPWRVIVRSVSVASQAGPQYLQQTAQGEYLLVDLTLINESNSPHTPNEYTTFELKQGKTKYDLSTGATTPETALMTNINPGVSSTMTVAFDVPHGDTPSQFTLLVAVQQVPFALSAPLIASAT